MTSLALNKWGHSYGVRIPQLVLKQLAIKPGDHLELEMDLAGQQIILKPAARRKGWREAFDKADINEEKGVELNFPNRFDEDEWIW